MVEVVASVWGEMVTIVVLVVVVVVVVVSAPLEHAPCVSPCLK